MAALSLNQPALMLSDAIPFLPMELEREIFEIAAVQNPGGIPSLLLVAKRVLEW